MENAPEYASTHGESALEDVRSHDEQHTPPHSNSTPERTGAPYSAQRISQRYPDLKVKEVTIRTRWFPWLLKVAPEPLLKMKNGYTDLAVLMFDDFAQKVKRDGMKSEAWVEDAKARFSQEWGNAGVIEGELMPEEVGGALATLQTQGNNLQQAFQAELEDLQAFVDQLNEVDEDFSEAELQMFKAKGAMRGVKRFRVETQTELEIYNQLRQQRMKGQGGQP
jgi:Asp-tRNA(Asn)/Glu-tRNA(Gln) amidotransferase C subunit